MICRNCQDEFNPSTSNQVYCSASCRNVDHVRRWRTRNKKTCPTCDAPIWPESQTCRQCQGKQLGDMALAEAIYAKHHRSSAYALVRTRARAIAKKLGITTCQLCGYCKHVEIAHRKAISDFPESAKLSEINHQSNLMALCRNCHWEIDHGLVEVPPPGLAPDLSV